MKKNLILTVMIVFAFMAMTNLVMAGPGCAGSKEKTSSVGCSKACAKICGIKVDDKAEADSDYKGKCEVVSMNISGMTCGGCESSITTALMKQEGVFKVVSIDHKSGLATICFDPTKVESDKLAKLVTKKGYKTEIMAAVATDELEAHYKTCAGAAKADETEKKDN